MTTAHQGDDLTRTQYLLLTFLRQYMGAYFTDQGLVDTWHHVAATPSSTLPSLTDTRIRAARHELTRAGLLHLAGHTTEHQQQIWTLDPTLTTH